MGYYTTYRLTVTADPTTKDAIEDYIQAALSKSDLFYGVSEGINGEYNESTKWYDHEKEMKELSAKFPEALFILNGEGEESMDIWETHYQGGEVVFNSTVEEDLKHYKQLLVLNKELCQRVDNYQAFDDVILEIDKKLSTWGIK